MDAKIPYAIGLGLHWQNRSILHNQLIDHRRLNEAGKVNKITHNSRPGLLSNQSYSTE